MRDHLQLLVRVGKQERKWKNKATFNPRKNKRNLRTANSFAGAFAASTPLFSVTFQPKFTLSKSGTIPDQCSCFASPRGCQKSDKRICVHEMEAHVLRVDSLRIFFDDLRDISSMVFVRFWFRDLFIEFFMRVYHVSKYVSKTWTITWTWTIADWWIW